MKTKKLTFLLFSFIFALCCSSCVTTVHTNKNGIPPGQVKKITGSKSAAPYAPGHNK